MSGRVFLRRIRICYQNQRSMSGSMTLHYFLVGVREDHIRSSWGRPLGDSSGALGVSFGALAGLGTGALETGFGALESTHIPLLLHVLQNP